MKYRNPLLTVDIIIECQGGIVLINRKNSPKGWALPGGFVDYNESIEFAAIREAKEETSLDIHLLEQMHTYSDPDRDPRHHSVSTVFIAKAQQFPVAGDDAKKTGVFKTTNLPSPLVFDHLKIINDYITYKEKGVPRAQVFSVTIPNGT